MKTQKNINVTSYYDEEVEKMIREKSAQLREQAMKDGRHFAELNRPIPVGDKISHYIGNIKSGFEELIANIKQHLQAEAHFPEGKIDTDHTQVRVNQLTEKVKENKNKIKNYKYDHETLNSSNINFRMRIFYIATILISLGEIIFNTMAFQVINDSKLFSLLLSIGVGIFVAVIAHYGAKRIKNEKHPRKIFVISLILSVITLPVFTGLALLRSMYLQSTNAETINPIIFILFNFCFFIASVILFLLFPSKEEIDNCHKNRLLENKIKKCERENVHLTDEIKRLEDDITEKNKQRIRIAYYSEYTVERVKKMYGECIALFISYNLKFRNDHATPDCFEEEPPELNINNPIIFYKSNKIDEL